MERVLAQMANGSRLIVEYREGVVTPASGVQHSGVSYVCHSSHTASSQTEPGVGAQWTEAWAVAGSALTPWQSGTDYVEAHTERIPEALRWEAPGLKPIWSYAQIKQATTDNVTRDVAYRCYGAIQHHDKEMGVTLDMSTETTKRVVIAGDRQAFFTDFTHFYARAYRRVHTNDISTRPDAPVETDGEKGRP